MKCPLLSVIAVFCAVQAASGCGPGRGMIRRRGSRKMTPLVYKQHIPNFSERSLAAAGLPEGSIDRKSPKFRHLVPNYNPDIVFKDEERTGADRLMTKRCKEKLNTLAISVMNQWPGVNLRVTEAWDEDMYHSHKSLHYEGRAVDITTSDRDRKKYGMLARLAVESGFDWVYYESRSHVHASCKSEATNPGKSGGCFTAEATVMTSSGNRKAMSDLKIGDEILAVDSDGELTFSPILLFLDRDPEERRAFVTLITEDGRSIEVTPHHLVFARRQSEADDSESSNDVEVTESDLSPTYAGDLEAGDVIYTLDLSGETAGSGSGKRPLRASRVVDTRLRMRNGVFAPLTVEGNLVVDGVLASCYAQIHSQTLAHWAFLPVRMLESIKQIFSSSHLSQGADSSTGIHWYAKSLYSMAPYVIPSQLP